ncbi:MAG: hypothetical protein ABIG43_03115, partial [Chloroflexota bacterium]
MKKQCLLVLIILLSLIGSSLSACGKNGMPAVAPTGEGTNQPDSETSATAEPSPTNTALPSQVILWASDGAELSLVSNTQALLLTLAEKDGLELVLSDSLSISDLTHAIRIVVALEPAPNLMSLVESAPHVQFLSVNIPNLIPGANLSVVNITKEDVEKRAFMAGYLAAVLTEDYRVGVLVQSGTEFGQSTRDSFFIGARYFCGLCNSRFAPIEYYPKLAEIADPTQQQSWQMAADLLIAGSVEAVYVQPEAASIDLLAYLMDSGVRIISAVSPTEGMQTDNWIGTLKLDPSFAIQEMWPKLLNGEGNTQGVLSISLIDTEAGWVSEGRMALFEKTLD